MFLTLVLDRNVIIVFLLKIRIVIYVLFPSTFLDHEHAKFLLLRLKKKCNKRNSKDPYSTRTLLVLIKGVVSFTRFKEVEVLYIEPSAE